MNARDFGHSELLEVMASRQRAEYPSPDVSRKFCRPPHERKHFEDILTTKEWRFSISTLMSKN
jgi:hypothetical protein